LELSTTKQRSKSLAVLAMFFAIVISVIELSNCQIVIFVISQYTLLQHSYFFYYQKGRVWCRENREYQEGHLVLCTSCCSIKERGRWRQEGKSFFVRTDYLMGHFDSYLIGNFMVAICFNRFELINIEFKVYKKKKSLLLYLFLWL